ncbi:MAG TPA: class I SAM-dependent methyltransferase [Acidimicrobiales bacterium]|nr:class I SAM-dependent methyltransferase [Acidimicrobiales bacterium]
MTSCRGCGHAGVQTVLSLGEQPLANALLAEDQLDGAEQRYPLDLAFCASCALAQTTVSIPPEELFTDYLYFSSYADAVTSNAKMLVHRVLGRRRLGSDSLVMEVASNDGYLLKHYAQAGIPVLGIDPARNVAADAEAAGVPTLTAFFGHDVAEQLRREGRRADVLHANNVLAHVPDVNGVISGISRVLADDGVAIVETPYVRDLVEKLEFDTIYHEHLFYYSLTSFRSLLNRHGLEVVDAERIPIHGGSLRVYAADSGTAAVAPAVDQLLAEERELGMSEIGYFEGFTARVNDLCAKLVELLDGLAADGARIAAYGAAAKGTVLLNAAGVDARRIEFVADRNPHKQGSYMPGVHVPVVGPEAISDRMPDYLLVLAWNFAEEVIGQQSEYAARGGRFIVPVPRPTIV